jgi:hypothetical protein
MKPQGPIHIAAAGLLLLMPAAASAQTEAGGAAGTAAGEGWFLQPGIGVAVPLADPEYDAFIDTSLDLSFAAGYLFSLGGGEAYIGPEVVVDYTFMDVDDRIEESAQIDAYAGRFRALAAGRFLLDFGGPFLFCRFGVGLDIMHSSWERTVAPFADDSSSDVGLALLNSIGFGARVSDMVGIVVIFDFPTSIHGHVNFGAPLDFPSVETTDIEMTLGVTIRL